MFKTGDMTLLDKSEPRRLARAVRRRLGREAPDAAALAVGHLPPPFLTRFKIVAGYLPLGGEIDPQPLLRAFAEAGARLALPAAEALDAPLAFRAWREGDALAPDAVGVPSPLADAPHLAPDLVIVPLLAFDGLGARLGQGGGHYDRTLAALRARRPVFALGLAFAGQEVASLPAESHDQALDAILTEIGYIQVSKDL